MTRNTSNQFAMQNPLTQYPQPEFPAQHQTEPGLDLNMTPEPDHGEESYVGFGRLAGRKAPTPGLAAPQPLPMPAKARTSYSTTCPRKSRTPRR